MKKIILYTLDIFVKLFDELKKNFNTGMIAWLLHRITGLALVFYILLHTFVIGSARYGAESFNKTLSSVQTTVFHVFEIGLIGCVFYHLLNGIRLLIIDFTFLSKIHKVLFWIFMIFFTGIMIWTSYIIIFGVILRETGGGA